MTLIAHSIGFEIPFVVGDILLSCDKVQKPFTPPTIFVDISEHLIEVNRTDFPSELAQKVYIITSNLVVALSGDVWEMTEFLIELKQQCSFYDNKPKVEHIHQILNAYDLQTNFSKASFFMMHVERKNDDSIYVTKFNRGRWDSLETELYKEVFANGSGAVSFRNWANDKVEFTSSHKKGDIYYAIQSNICLVSKLLAIERSSLETLKKNWGAGFELVFYTGETFEKYQQIAYLLFEAEFDEEGNIGDPALTKAMYYKYVDGTLVIISIDLINATYNEYENHLKINGNNLRVGTFPVFPIDLKEKPNEEIFENDISFITYRVGVAYIIVKNKEQLFIPAFFNEGPEVKVEFTQGKLFEVHMDLQILKDIKEGAKKAYPQV